MAKTHVRSAALLLVSSVLLGGCIPLTETQFLLVQAEAITTDSSFKGPEF